MMRVLTASNWLVLMPARRYLTFERGSIPTYPCSIKLSSTECCCVWVLMYFSKSQQRFSPLLQLVFGQVGHVINVLQSQEVMVVDAQVGHPSITGFLSGFGIRPRRILTGHKGDDVPYLLTVYKVDWVRFPNTSSVDRKILGSCNHLILNGWESIHVRSNVDILANDICERDLPLAEDRAEVFIDGLHRLRPILWVDDRQLIWILVHGFELAELANGTNGFERNTGHGDSAANTNLMVQVKGEEPLSG